jgi:type III secretion protein U
MAEKTEKPTDKKLRDSAEKGQTFKSKDVVAVVVLLTAVFSSGVIVDLPAIMREFMAVAQYGPRMDPADYLRHWTWAFVKRSLPFVAVCAFAGIIPTLFQTRFTLAFKAIKLDLSSLNPVAGFKKIFGLRMVKELVKSLLYLVVMSVTAWIFVLVNSHTVFNLFEARPVLLGHFWVALTARMVLLFLACAAPVLAFDVGMEFFLYYKDLMMDKHEIKQELKDSEGNPEIRSKRKELANEFLSEESKATIEQSSFVVANPTHIAIGIYIRKDLTHLPFVSIREANARALAVIRYAELKGVPVIRNVALARSIYAHCPRRFMFVAAEDIFAVTQILRWLKEVETANGPGEPHSEAETASQQEGAYPDGPQGDADAREARTSGRAGA